MSEQDTNRTNAFSDGGRELSDEHQDNESINTTRNDGNGSISSRVQHHEQDDYGQSHDQNPLTKDDRQHALDGRKHYFEVLIPSANAFQSSSEQSHSKRRARSQSLLDPYGSEIGNVDDDLRESKVSASSSRTNPCGRISDSDNSEFNSIGCGDERIFPGHPDYLDQDKQYKPNTSYYKPSHRYESNYHYQKPVTKSLMTGRSGRLTFPILPVATKVFRSPPQGYQKRSQPNEAFLERGFGQEELEEGIERRFVHKPKSAVTGRMFAAEHSSFESPSVARGYSSAFAAYEDPRDYPSDEVVGTKFVRYRDEYPSRAKRYHSSLEDRTPVSSRYTTRKYAIESEEEAWLRRPFTNMQDDSRYGRSQALAYDGTRMNPYNSVREAMEPAERRVRYTEDFPFYDDSDGVDPSRVRKRQRGDSLFTFGPNEAMVDLHVLVMAGQTFDEGRFSSSKVILDGFDYEFRDLKSKKVLGPGRLGDVGTMAKNIASSFHLGDSRTMRVEIINAGEIIRLGPRLTHVVLLVGLREEKESPEPPLQNGLGRVIKITKGKYKGCRGILKQVNDGNAMVRVATGDSKGTSAVIPQGYIEIMEESELLMHVCTVGRSNIEEENLFIAPNGEANEVLQSFKSDMFDTVTYNQFSVIDGGSSTKEGNNSIPNGDFMTDISDHLVNTFDPELYHMMETDHVETQDMNEKAGLGQPGTNDGPHDEVAYLGYHDRDKDPSLSRRATPGSGEKIHRSTPIDTEILPPLEIAVCETDGQAQHDDETDAESNMQELPLPPAADLPAAVPMPPDDDASTEAKDDDEDDDEDFEINSIKPKKKSLLPRAPRLPLAASRSTSGSTHAPNASKAIPSNFKGTRSTQSELAPVSSDTESESWSLPKPLPEITKPRRGRPRTKLRNRDMTSAWNFLQSLSVLELKDKLKQMKMSSAGSKGMLLKQLKAALDIDRETPMAVLPGILTKL